MIFLNRMAFGLFFSLSLATAKDPTYLDTPIDVPGHIEAENHVAISGTVPTVLTPRYEVGLGEILKGATDGSSVDYSVDIDGAGLYEIKIRYARSGTDPAPSLRMSNGATILFTVDLPETTSDFRFETVTVPDVSLPNGLQTLRLTFIDNAAPSSALANTSVNWIDFRAQGDDGPPTHEFYVSINGNDTAAGTFADPFRTFQRAIDEIATLNTNQPDHGPVTVWFRGGYHEVTSTINVNSSHSGTRQGPITFRAYPGENAMIGGGRKVPLNAFTLVQSGDSDDSYVPPTALGNVYRATLNDADWQARLPGGFNQGMVSSDGSALQLATYPNKGLVTAVDANSNDQVFRPSPGLPDANRWRSEELRAGSNILVLGHMQSDEFEERSTLTNVATNGRVTMADAFEKISNNNRKLRFVNVLADLDIPGEWYYDQDTNIFYLWPIRSLSEEPDIRIGINDRLISGSGVNYWIVRDLIFQDVAGTGDFTGASDMINLTGDNHLWGGNIFRNANSRNGFRLDGRYNRVTSNEFYAVAAPYVISGGDRSVFPVVHSQTEFTNNRVRDLWNRGYGGGGINGVGIRFSNNHITNVQGGNNYSESFDTLLELNEWYDSGYELGDWNVAYVGATYSHWGTLVRHNFVHHILRPSNRRRAGAFRGDDGTAGLNFHGNVFFKTVDYGITFTRIGAAASNNIMVESESLLLSEPKDGLIGTRVQTAGEVLAEYNAQQAATDLGDKANLLLRAEADLMADFWTTSYFGYKYPAIATEFNIDMSPSDPNAIAVNNPWDYGDTEFTRNYVSEVTNPVTQRVGLPNPSTLIETFESPIDINQSASFEDPDILDFRFKTSFSPVSGFWEIPFDQIGLYTDEFRTTVPHKPTYRANAKLRWDGFTAPSGSIGNDRYPDPNFNRARTYDLGSYTSPLFDLATLLTPETTGEFGWVNPTGLSVSTGGSGSPNDLNIDRIRGSQAATFEQVVENGPWYILVTFGDSVARDQMAASIEGIQQVTNFGTNAGQYLNALLAANVLDGKLTLLLEDSGGSNSTWAVSRIRVQNTPFDGQSSIPLNEDRDNDGLTDRTELALNINPLSNDTDSDGVEDGDEVNTYGTHPEVADSDGDGLSDGVEINTYQTDPLLTDTDDDGLSDGDEVNTHGTNPLLADSDSDGASDGLEITLSTDPGNPSSSPLFDSLTIRNLVGYWAFDETDGGTAFDSIKTADAVWQDGVSNNLNWVSGIIGGAADLGGGGDEFFLVSSDPLAGVTELTLSAWVNPDTTGGFKGVVTTRANPPSDNSLNWGLNVDGAQIDYRYDSLPFDSASGSVTATDSSTNNNGWYHLVLTWNVSGKREAYLNGILVDQAPAGTSPMNFATGGMWWFGEDACCGNREINGRIDDFAMFDKALTASEIISIYTAGQANLAVTELLPRPPFSVSSITPVTGNENDLTLAWFSEPSRTYQVLTSTDLNLPLADWTVLASNLTSTDYRMTFTHVGGGVDPDHRFYVVALLSP